MKQAFSIITKMKTKLFVSFILFSLLFSNSSYSQNQNFAKLDSLFQTLEENNKFMGSIALSQNGQLIYSKSVGYADAESSLKSTGETKYRIGSISKIFTATMILKAVEEKKISLDKTIESYFPLVENANKITIRNLLNHHSGIQSFTDNADYKSWCSHPKSVKELVEIISNGKSEFEPGSKGKYSNSNYVLLSIILEKIYKKNFSEIIKSKIIKPLGLKNTYLGGKIDIDNQECFSYRFNNKWLKEIETDMSIPMGAGAVVSNPTDLTKFIEALFEGKIISKNSLKTMTTLEDNFGLGIFAYPFYDKKLYGHTGGIDGFASMLTIMPEDNLSVAVTSNGVNFSINTIILSALSSYYGTPFDIPSFKTLELSAEELDLYLGVYSSSQLPLKITITKQGNKLFGQGSGQAPFALESFEKNKFKGANGMIILEFNPQEGVMVLKQGGATFTFSR